MIILKININLKGGGRDMKQRLNDDIRVDVLARALRIGGKGQEEAILRESWVSSETVEKGMIDRKGFAYHLGHLCAWWTPEDVVAYYG